MFLSILEVDAPRRGKDGTTPISNGQAKIEEILNRELDPMRQAYWIGCRPRMSKPHSREEEILDAYFDGREPLLHFVVRKIGLHGLIDLAVHLDCSSDLDLEIFREACNILNLDHIPVSMLLDHPIIVERECGGIAYIFLFRETRIDPRTDYRMVGIEGEGNYSASRYEGIRRSLDVLRRIDVFCLVQRRLADDPVIERQTERAAFQTRVYSEQFHSEKEPHRAGRVSFWETTTLEAAQRYAQKSKTVILNFANPLEPGGGILRGANAQEESLCRRSDLYNTFCTPRAEAYYRANNELRQQDPYSARFLGTDALIYSPGVTFLKSTDAVDPFSEHPIYSWGTAHDWSKNYTSRFYIDDAPQPGEGTFTADVITAAAPIFVTPESQMPSSELQNVLESRIRNILEAAIDHEAETLILGAFGCGAFHNPPDVVAAAFHRVLQQLRYAAAFENVVFAVCTTPGNTKNRDVFRDAFDTVQGVIGGRYKVQDKIRLFGVVSGGVTVDETTKEQFFVQVYDKRKAKLTEEEGTRLFEGLQELKRFKQSALPVYHEILEDAQYIFLLQPYIQGESLGKRLKKGALSEQASVDIGIQLVEAMRYLYGSFSAPLLPELLPEPAASSMAILSGNRLMLDYFTLFFIGRVLKRKPAYDGPTDHRPPELLLPGDNNKADERADVYIVGTLLYKMVTATQARSHLWLPISEVCLPLSQSFRRIAEKCMRPSPAARFQTMSELLEALKNC